MIANSRKHKAHVRNRMGDINSGLQEAQADYRMAKRSSRFGSERRGIPSMGASSDYHYKTDGDYVWMGEIARDIDRNDVVLGQVLDRVVDNEIQDGFKPQADTGDSKLDADLEARWADEAQDPELCDITADRTFHDQECLVAREVKLVGDIFVVPVVDDEGREAPQLIENYRCRSLQTVRRQDETPKIVHGVEIDKYRRPLRYFFTKENVDPFTQTKSLSMKQMMPVDAWKSDPLTGLNFKQVWHVADKKRPTQTRGITALAPIFDVVGMHDDIQYSKLVQQQIHSFFCFVKNREMGWEGDLDDESQGTTPRRHRTNDYDNETRELIPGMDIEGDPGEKVDPWSAAVPNPEFFDHAKLLLTLIGINLGAPLVMVLMDAGETNFSGYRGAIEQARLQFRRNQRTRIAKFYRPYWHWKVRKWLDDDPALMRAFNKKRGQPNLFHHRWQPTSWPYIEPTKDAMADLMRGANSLDARRTIAAERGGDLETIQRLNVSDAAAGIRMAVEQANQLNDEFALDDDNKILWHQLWQPPMPQGVTLSMSADLGGSNSESAAVAE